MRRLSIVAPVLASFVIALLFIGWPVMNTRLSYQEPVVYTTSAPLDSTPAVVNKKLRIASRFVKVGEKIALDDYFVPPIGSTLKYHDFSTRFDEVVKIDSEERTATFEQNGVFTICGTLYAKRCEVIIAEEEPIHLYPR